MVIMEGRCRAAILQLERDVALAWHIANFTRAKNLPDLGRTLEKLRPAKPQTADDVAGIFLSLQAAGKSVNIRERPKKGT